MLSLSLLTLPVQMHGKRLLHYHKVRPEIRRIQAASDEVSVLPLLVVCQI